MSEKNGSGGAFVSVVLGLVGVLVVAYVVFLTLKMARTDGARQTLLALAVALAAGGLAAAAGLVGTGRR